MFQYFPEHPILGHGSEAFEGLSPWDTHSHTNYVELLVNHGLVGFFIYYLMMVRILAGYKGMPVFERLRLASLVVVLLLADTWDINYMSRVVAAVLCLTLIVAAREIRPAALE